jgi:hypothetical protein
VAYSAGNCLILLNHTFAYYTFIMDDKLRLENLKNKRYADAAEKTEIYDLICTASGGT